MIKLDFALLFMHDNQIKFSIFAVFASLFATGCFIIYTNMFFMTLSIVLTIISIIWYSYRYSTIKYFVSHAVEVKATIIQVFTSSSLARINIKFNYEEETYTFSQSTYTTRLVQQFANGQPVVCLINPKHPDKAMIKSLICKN